MLVFDAVYLTRPNSDCCNTTVCCCLLYRNDTRKHRASLSKHLSYGKKHRWRSSDPKQTTNKQLTITAISSSLPCRRRRVSWCLRVPSGAHRNTQYFSFVFAQAWTLLEKWIWTPKGNFPAEAPPYSQGKTQPHCPAESFQWRSKTLNRGRSRELLPCQSQFISLTCGKAKKTERAGMGMEMDEEEEEEEGEERACAIGRGVR